MTTASKFDRYQQLVRDRKACRRCKGLTNASECSGGEFDRDEIGAWSRWQGNLDAEIAVVGQDWGDVAWFVREKGVDTSASATNATLQKLLASIGFHIEPPATAKARGTIFLTNAVLCLKKGGAQAKVERSWFDNCGPAFLRPLIEIVKPKVVVCLSERAYNALLHSYLIPYGKFSSAVDRQEPELLPNGPAVFAVYHCGARVLNMHRRLDAQLHDWKRVASYLSKSPTKAFA